MAGGHRCGRSIRLPQAVARPSAWSHGITGLARPCPTHPFHMRSGGKQAHPSSAQALASSGGGQLTTGPLSPARPPSARKHERDWCPAMGSASAGLQHHRSAARGVRGGRSVLDFLALCGGLTGADRRSRKGRLLRVGGIAELTCSRADSSSAASVLPGPRGKSCGSSGGCRRQRSASRDEAVALLEEVPFWSRCGTHCDA